MVAFQTLFLGLVFGLAPVRVTVGPPVVSVDLLLDSVAVGTMTGEPWEIPCNFGPSPLPHELVAVGRDAEGKEVKRVSQLLNLPRPLAEAQLTVKPGATGKPSSASLTWSTMDNAKPKRIELTLDGVEVKVKDPERIELPGVDLSRTHFLAAEIVFQKGAVARAEASFGGETEATAESKLTAYAVVLRPGHEMPPAEAMQGWFRKDGNALQVVAVEEGNLDVVMVFDQDSNGRFLSITRGNTNSMILDHEVAIQPSKGGNRLTALWAVPRSIVGPDKREIRGLFPASITLDLDIDSVRTFIFRFPFPAAGRDKQELANAVAAAGMQAAALGRRRAVVMVVGEAVEDQSTISPRGARAYLESLNVPLFVWTPERRISALDLPGWGLPDNASTDQQLQAAMGRLEKALKAQRIVWLAGSHLPSAITIAPNVRHIFPARGVVRQERS